MIPKYLRASSGTAILPVTPLIYIILNRLEVTLLGANKVYVGAYGIMLFLLYCRMGVAHQKPYSID
jgi:hypothetical protein